MQQSNIQNKFKTSLHLTRFFFSVIQFLKNQPIKTQMKLT